MVFMTSLPICDLKLINRMYEVDWIMVGRTLYESGSSKVYDYLNSCPRTKEFQDILNSMPDDKFYHYWFVHINKYNDEFDLRFELRLEGDDKLLTLIRLSI